jgi:glycosyltransferase involved in cell wall biosynthesis
MIVKDEAANIERCLWSAISAGVTVATVVDTGSTDRTQKLVREVCAGIDLRLSSVPFVNMGQARSVAFERAQHTADWLVALDADMTVEIDADFAPGCCGEHDVCNTDHWQCERYKESQAIEAYQIEMRDGQWSWRLPLLLRGDLPWRSIGAYHEYTCIPGRGFVGAVTDAVRVHFPSTPTSVAKRHWQAGLLETYLAEHPDDERTLFYVAQTRRELGDPRARGDYLRRAGMGGFEEEAWWAQYHAANLAPDWPTRAVELMAAWERRPSRLEALRDLVRELNNRGSHRAAYALACAADMTPCSDIGFTEPAVWAWGMTFERSIAAWWCGYPDETRALSENLLDRDDLPGDVRAAVERNLGLSSPAVAA